MRTPPAVSRSPLKYVYQAALSHREEAMQTSRAGRSSRIAKTLIDGLDTLELVVCNDAATKEMRELKSDMVHLPVPCKHLVEGAMGASRERIVKISE